MSDKKPEYKEIDAGRIRELAAILFETGLTEIEIEKGDVRLRVSRAVSGVSAQIAAAPAPAAPAPAPEAGAPAAPAPLGKAHPGAVQSPMVGTAYLSAAPGTAPFVRPGDRVAMGQTLMIIEAMKTMNPIAAPRAGIVKEIFVTDAQPVEFGEALLVIE